MNLTSVEESRKLENQKNMVIDNERMRIQQWAVLNANKNIFQEYADESEETYWKSREKEDTYIMMYDFETVPEFEKLCTTFLPGILDKEIQRVISVAVFKNRPQHTDVIKHTKKNAEGLPMYIYAF